MGKLGITDSAAIGRHPAARDENRQATEKPRSLSSLRPFGKAIIPAPAGAHR
jgi:hypothetical protein